MAFERRILTTYDASTAGFDRGTRRVEAQLARLQRTTDDRLRSIDQRFERAGRAVLRLGTALGTIGAGLSVAAVRNYAEAWRQVERNLTAAGFAVEGNQEKISQLAIRTRGSFEATGAAVSRFARATGAGLDETIRRVETLDKLLAVGGASGAERGAVTLQLSQALASGVLQGDELRSLREAAPVEFLDAIAKRAGVTRGELKDLGAEGALTAEIILGALDDLATTADQKFGALAISGSEAVNVLTTGFATFFGRVDQQLGATAGINEFLSDIGTFLADDAEAAATFAKSLEVAAVAAASLAGGRALGAVNTVLREGAALRQAAVVQNRAAVAAAQAEVAANIRKVQTARDAAIAAREQAAAAAQQAAALNRATASTVQLAQARRALQVADAAVIKTNAQLTVATNALAASETRANAASNALAVSQGRLSAATRITTAAVGALRGVLAFFGGVPGLIFAAATAAVYFATTMSDSGDAAQDAASSVSTLNGAVDDLKSAQDAYASAISATAGVQTSASASIVADTRREFEAKRALLELEIKRQQALQAERQARISSVQTNLERIPSSESVRQNVLRGGIRESENISDADRRRVIDAEIERAAQVAAVRDQLKGLTAEAELSQLAIERALQAVNTPFADTGAGAGAPAVGGATGGGGGGRSRRTAIDAAEQETERLREAYDRIVASGREFIEQQRLEGQALTLTEEAAARLRFEQDLLNDATRAGIELLPEQAAELRLLAAEMARTEANTIAAADQLDFARDATGGFFSDLVTGLRNGESVWQTFANAANRSLDLVIDKLLNEVLNAIFRVNDAASGIGGGGGGGFGGILGIFGSIAGAVGGLFGGGSTAGLTSGQIRIAQLHSGGVVGRDGLMRSAPAALFDNAPRFHSGGVAGLMPNEVPAILERGEVVVPNGASMAGNSFVIDASTTVNIDRPGASMEEIERRLEPRLAVHREETIAKIRKSSSLNPRFLEG